MTARRPAFSRRTAWNLAANRLTARLEALRASGAPLLDLTETNPTRSGLAWSVGTLAQALSHPEVAGYEPDPRGLATARRAVATYLAGRGAPVDAGRVLLTASTSEGYALLLKLLCDPGDEVLAPAPSYPLLDVLCELEGVRLVRYALTYDGSWHLDLATLDRAVTDRTRAVVVVTPGSPTGAVLDGETLERLSALCADRGLALVGDEVFADTATSPPSVAATRGCLAFHLAGLSKTCGLPQVKAAWIAAAGPEPLVTPALERLEVIADAYLSVSAPAQLALPELLARRDPFLRRLRQRLAANRAALERLARGAPFDVLRGEGGWSAVIRAGACVDEDATCLALLDAGVVVQPGYFYDFERPGHLVLSLLPPSEVFAAGAERVARHLGGVL